MKPQNTIIVAVLFASGFLVAASASQTPPVTGLYSDMSYIEAEGDYVGTEVFILLSMEEDGPEYFALVQFAEGVPLRPQLVEVSIDGTEIQFDAEFLGGQNVHFVGNVFEDSLRGRFEGIDVEVTLERGQSVWQ